MTIYDSKTKHMLTVARLMYRIALELGWGEDKAREMFLLGYIHDVGYEFAETSDMHPYLGFKISADSGYKYAAIIGKHGCKMNEHTPPELILLNSADLQVDINGEYVGFDKRLKDIELRYGPNSKQAKNAAFNADICRKKGFWLNEDSDAGI